LRTLTSVDAKHALVELLRKNPTAFQRRFDWEGLAKQALVDHGSGECTCGGFRISVPRATYQITVTYGCRFEYEGTFQFQWGRWIASQPEWTSAALLK
jgi:hypothetical protein